MTLKLPLQPIQPVAVRQTIKPIQVNRPLTPLAPGEFRTTDHVYSDPREVNSFTDVLFNKRGRTVAHIKQFGTVAEDDLLGSLAETVAAAVYHLQNSYVEPLIQGDLVQFAVNSINAFGEDADVASNLTKGMIIEAGTQESSLLFGALASVAALGATLATGGTFAMAMSAGFIAGGVTATGNAVLADPEGAARGFEKAAGYGASGKTNYNFNLEGDNPLNWFGEMYGEIAVDPLNWISFSSTFLEKYAEKMARKAGTQFTTGTNVFLGALESIGKIDNVITKAAFISNPLGLGLYGLYSGTKWMGSAAQRSIRTALLGGEIEDFLGLSDVFDNSYKVVKKELGQIRSTYGTQLGFLKKSDDVYFQWFQNTQNALMKTGHMSKETASETARLLLHGFLTSKDFAFLGDITDKVKTLNLLDTQLNQLVVMTTDSAATTKLGKLVSELGGAADYVASNYKPGLDAVSAFVDEISSYSDSLNMLVERVNGDLDKVANEMIKAVKSGIVGKSKAEYMFQAYEALAKVYPDIKKGGFVNSKAQSSRFNAYIYATFFAPAGITEAEYLLFQKSLSQGKYSLEHPETIKDAIAQQIKGEVRTMSGAFRDTVELSKALADTKSESAQLLKALGEGAGSLSKINKALFGGVKPEASSAVSWVEAFTRGIKNHLTPEAQQRMVARFDDEVVGKPLMEIVHRYAKLGNAEMVDELIKIFGEDNKRVAEKFAQIIRDLDTLEQGVRNPDAIFKSLSNRSSELSKLAEEAKAGSLMSSTIKAARPEDRFISAYLNLAQLTRDDVFKPFAKINEEALRSSELYRLFLAPFENFNAFNPSALIGIEQGVELELRAMGAYALDVSQTLLDQVATEKLLSSGVIDMFYELMDENQPVGRLFAYIANGPDLAIHPEFQEVYAEVRKIYATMKSFQHYIEFSRHVKQIMDITVAIDPNRKVITQMQLPVKVLQDEGAVIRVKLIDGGTGEFTIDELMRNEEYAKLLKGEDTVFTVFDADQVNFVRSQDVLQDIEAAGKISTTFKEELDALQVLEVSKRTSDLAQLNIQLESITREIAELRDKQRILMETSMADTKELTDQILGDLKIIDTRLAEIDARLAQLDPDSPAAGYVEEITRLKEEKETLVIQRETKEAKFKDDKQKLATARRKITLLEKKIRKQTEENQVFVQTIERKMESLSREFKRLEDDLTTQREIVKLQINKKILAISDRVLKRARKSVQYVQDKNIVAALNDLSKKMNVSPTSLDLYARIQQINTIVKSVETSVESFKTRIGDERVAYDILEQSAEMYSNMGKQPDKVVAVTYDRVSFKQVRKGAQVTEEHGRAFILDVVFDGNKPVFVPDYGPENFGTRTGYKKPVLQFNSVAEFVGFREHVHGRLLHNLFDDSMFKETFNRQVSQARDNVLEAIRAVRERVLADQKELASIQRSLAGLKVDYETLLAKFKKERITAFVRDVNADLVRAMYGDIDLTKAVERLLLTPGEASDDGFILPKSVRDITSKIKNLEEVYQQKLKKGLDLKKEIDIRVEASNNLASRDLIPLITREVKAVGASLYPDTDPRYVANFSDESLQDMFSDVLSVHGDFNQTKFLEKLNKLVMLTGRPEIMIAGQKTKNYSEVFQNQLFQLGRRYTDIYRELTEVRGLEPALAIEESNNRINVEFLEWVEEAGIAKFKDQDERIKFLTNITSKDSKFNWQDLDKDARRLVLDSVDKNGTHFKLANFTPEIAASQFPERSGLFRAYYKPIQQLMAVFMDGQSTLWRGADEARLKQNQVAYEEELARQQVAVHLELKKETDELTKTIAELKVEQAKFEAEHLKDYEQIPSDAAQVFADFRKRFESTQGSGFDVRRYNKMMGYTNYDASQWADLYADLRDKQSLGLADEWFDMVEGAISRQYTSSKANYILNLDPELRAKYISIQDKIRKAEIRLNDITGFDANQKARLEDRVAIKKTAVEETKKALEDLKPTDDGYVHKKPNLVKTLQSREKALLKAQEELNEYRATSLEDSLAMSRTRAWQASQAAIDANNAQLYFVWDEAAIKSFLAKNPQFSMDDVSRLFYSTLNESGENRPVLIRNHTVPVAQAGQDTGLDDIGRFTKETLVHNFLRRGQEFYYDYPRADGKLMGYAEFIAQLRGEWGEIKGMKRVHDQWFSGERMYQPLIFGQRRTPFDLEKQAVVRNIPEDANQMLKNAMYSRSFEFRNYKEQMDSIKALGYDSPAPYGMDITNDITGLQEQVIEPIKGFPLMVVLDDSKSRTKNVSLLPPEYQAVYTQIQGDYQKLNDEIAEFENTKLKHADELNSWGMMTPGREVIVNEHGSGKVISVSETTVFDEDYRREQRSIVVQTHGDLKFDTPSDGKGAHNLNYKTFVANQKALYSRKGSQVLFVRLDKPVEVKGGLMYNPNFVNEKDTGRYILKDEKGKIAVKVGDRFVIPALMDKDNVGNIGVITNVYNDTKHFIPQDPKTGNTYRVDYEVHQVLEGGTVVPKKDIRIKYSGPGIGATVRRTDTLGTYEEFGRLKRKQERYSRFFASDFEKDLLTNRYSLSDIRGRLKGDMNVVKGERPLLKGVKKKVLSGALVYDLDEAPDNVSQIVSKNPITISPELQAMLPDGDPDIVVDLVHEDVLKVLVGGAVTNFQYQNEAYYFLSNTYSLGKYSVKMEGMEFNSTEAAFQAAKFKNLADRRAIQEATLPKQKYPSGKAAKLKAKELLDDYNKLPKEVRDTLVYTEEEWNAKKMDVMYGVLRQKFSIPEHAKKLVATGSAALVESNFWNDDFWGMHTAAGKNELGRMLMRIRGELGGTGEVPFRLGQQVYVSRQVKLQPDSVGFMKAVDDIKASKEVKNIPVQVSAEAQKAASPQVVTDPKRKIRIFKSDPVNEEGPTIAVYNLGQKSNDVSGVNYVGRNFAGNDASPLANPFRVAEHTEAGHQAAVDKYTTWLMDKFKDPNSPQAVEYMRLKELYNATGEIKLGCWCAPLPCHADVIAKLIMDDYTPGFSITKAVSEVPAKPVVQVASPAAPRKFVSAVGGVQRIISGGQSGGDLGGLIAGKRMGMETGGTMPKGFYTETGNRPEYATEYGVVEDTASSDITASYRARSMKNVDDADVTIAFLWGPSPGTVATIGYANYKIWGGRWEDAQRKQYKPVLVVDSKDTDNAAIQIYDFLKKHPAKTINVVGSRESKYPGIQKFVEDTLVKALYNTDHVPVGAHTYPDSSLITKLEPNDVFVFGSNLQGNHGQGAAYTAKKLFGAKQGQAVGLQGQSYAFATKSTPYRSLDVGSKEFNDQFPKFLQIVKSSSRRFIFTDVGTGRALIQPDEVAGRLAQHMVQMGFFPSNIVFSEDMYARVTKHYITMANAYIDEMNDGPMTEYVKQKIAGLNAGVDLILSRQKDPSLGASQYSSSSASEYFQKEVLDPVQAAVKEAEVPAPKIEAPKPISKGKAKVLNNNEVLQGRRYETHDEYLKRVVKEQEEAARNNQFTPQEIATFELDLKTQMPEVYGWYSTLTKEQKLDFIRNPQIPDVVADILGDAKTKGGHSAALAKIKDQGARMLDVSTKARTDYLDMLQKRSELEGSIREEIGYGSFEEANEFVAKMEETLKATMGDTEEVRAQIEELKKKMYEIVAAEDARRTTAFKEKKQLTVQRKELAGKMDAANRTAALTKVSTDIGNLMESQYVVRGKVFEAEKLRGQAQTVAYRKGLEDQALERMFGPKYKELMPLITRLQKGEITAEEFVMLKNNADGLVNENGEAVLTRRFSRLNVLDRMHSTQIQGGRLVERLMDDPKRQKTGLSLIRRAMDIINEVRSLTPGEAEDILGDNAAIKARFADITSDPDLDKIIDYLVQEIRNLLDMNSQFSSSGIRMVMIPDVATRGSLEKLFSGLLETFVKGVNDPKFQKDLYLENVNRFMNNYVTKYDGMDPVVKEVTAGYNAAKDVQAQGRKFLVMSEDHLNKIKSTTSLVGQRVGEEGTRSHNLVLRYLELGGRELLEKYPGLKDVWDSLTWEQKEEYINRFGIVNSVDELLIDRYATMIRRQTIREAEMATIGSLDHAGKVEAITGGGSAVVPVMEQLDKELEYARSNLTESIADALYNSQIQNRAMLSLVRDIEVESFQSPRRFGVFGTRQGYGVVANRSIKLLKGMMSAENPQNFVSVLKHHTVGSTLTIQRAVFGDLDPRVVARLLDMYGVEIKYVDKTPTFVHDLVVIRFVDGKGPDVPIIPGMFEDFIDDPSELGVKDMDSLNALFKEMQLSAKQHTPFQWYDVPTFRISDEHLPRQLRELGILDELQERQYVSALQDSGVLGLTVIGDADFMDAMSGHRLPESPLRSMITSTTSLSKHSTAKTKFIRLFFRPEYSLENIFGSSDPRQIYKRLKSMKDVFEVIVLKEDLSAHRVTIYSWKDIEWAMQNKAIVTNYPGFVKIYQSLDNWKTPALLDWMERNLNSIYTSGVMTSPAMAIRNMLDNTVKLLAMAGGDVDSLAFIPEAHRYMERFKEIALEMKDLQDGVSVIEHLRGMSEEDRMIYFLLTQAGEMRTSGAPMETYLDITEAARKARELRGVAKVEGSVIQNIMWGNKLTQLALEMQNWSEQRWRLAGYLYMMNKGATASETAKRVAEYFIDYSVKNKGLKVLKILAPFSMFTVKNTLLWAEHAADTPWLYRTMIDAGVASWNQARAEQDGYMNRAQESNYLMGNISLGKSVLKVNPSFFDAINAIPGLVKDPLGRLTPVINNPIKFLSGDTDSITMPWEGVASKASSVVGGVNKLMQGEDIRASDFAPGMVSDFTQYTSRYTAYNSYSTRYVALQNMKVVRRNYRNILRSSNYYRKNVFYSTVGRGFKPYKVPR